MAKTAKSPNVRARTPDETRSVSYRSGEKEKKGGPGGKKGKGEHHRARKDVRMKKANEALKKGMSVHTPTVVDPRGLSPRDAAFVTNLLKGMSKVEAMKLASEAIGVDISQERANQLAQNALGRGAVDSAIVAALEKAGIDDELIAKRLRQGLDATAFTQTGFEHTDFKGRLAYIHTILKVKGQIGADVANQQAILNYTTFKDED